MSEQKHVKGDCASFSRDLRCGGHNVTCRRCIGDAGRRCAGDQECRQVNLKQSVGAGVGIVAAEDGEWLAALRPAPSSVACWRRPITGPTTTMHRDPIIMGPD